MLIHMTPQEVGGLQALAKSYGGSLSINPDTGLPEAGFLKSILPTLIGAGLTFFSGGVINPMTAGLITGGIQTARTGDLGQGILAGLGAFGGGGIGSALTSTGASSASNIAANLGTEAATGTGSQAAQLAAQNQGFGQAGLDLTRQAASTATGANMATPTLSSIELAGKGLSSLSEPGQFSNFASNLGDVFSTTGKQVGATIGLTAPFMPPEPTLEFPEPEDPYANYEGPYTPTKREVSYPSVLDSREFNYFDKSNPIPYAEGGETEDRSIKRPGADYNVNQGEFDYNFRPVEFNTSRALGDGTAPVGDVSSPERTASERLISLLRGENANSIIGYGADGSPVYAQNPAQMSGKGGGKGGRMSGGDGAPAGMSDKDRKKYGYDKYENPANLVYDPETQELVRRYAQGGLTAFAKGRFLEGPGDGTSDDIPAVIGNRQPARLADGEFVIDARTVSEIGNGSSKAGAKKLYAMMDRVHNERKKASRGKDSKADKHLPA
jgi:hypothetical protein